MMVELETAGKKHTNETNSALSGTLLLFALTLTLCLRLNVAYSQMIQEVADRTTYRYVRDHRRSSDSWK